MNCEAARRVAAVCRLPEAGEVQKRVKAAVPGPAAPTFSG